MIFHAFLTDVNESNAYVVGCADTGRALLIDAGGFDAQILEFLAEKRLQLDAVFITHDHYDHVGGLEELTERANPDATVYSGRGKAGGRHACRVVHGDKIAVGHLTGTTLSTPGHTQDSVSLVFPGVVFTGDALFSGSVGGTTSPETARQQIECLSDHVLTLPDDWEVYPGHGPASVVWVERQYNPFLTRPQ